MKARRWRAGAIGLLPGLGLLVATRLLAAPAEIAGIERVYLRAGPGSEQSVIATLSAGDAVNILDIEGSWTKVETRDGRVGFVYHRYVVPKVAAPSGKPTTPPSGAVRAPAVSGGDATRTAPVAAAEAIKPAPAAVTPAVTPGAGMPGSGGEIAAEIAGLRAEIADLKQKIQDRSADLAADRPAPVTPSEAPAAANPGSSREQSVGAVAVALLSLLVGWVLGSAFTRRRSRSQRSRLRF